MDEMQSGVKCICHAYPQRGHVMHDVMENSPCWWKCKQVTAKTQLNRIKTAPGSTDQRVSRLLDPTTREI